MRRLSVAPLVVIVFLYSCRESERNRTPALKAAQSGGAASQSEIVRLNSSPGAPDVVVTPEEPQPAERNHVTVLAKARFDDRYTVAVEALTQSDRFTRPDNAYLQRGDSVRISVTEAGTSPSQWEAAIMRPAEGETRAVVERIGRNSVVVRQCNVDYGLCGKSVKLFFDLTSKTVLGRAEFLPLAVSHFVVMDDAFYSVASAEQNDFAVARYDSGQPRLVSGAERDAVLAMLVQPPPPRTDRASFLKSGPLDRSFSPEAQRDYYVEIRPKSGFWLSLGAGSLQVGVEGVAERTTDGYDLHALPQSAPGDVFQRRPTLRGRWSGVASLEQSQIREGIGPYAVVDGRLWFGKTFYDSEGLAGVGAVGFFDPEKRKYTLYSPQAIADWSTSAMLVEEDTVWAGLVRYPEGAAYSGGLLRLERSSQKTEIYPVARVIGRIARWRDGLYIGTSAGVEVIRAGQIAGRYTFEPALNSGFEILAVTD